MLICDTFFSPIELWAWVQFPDFPAPVHVRILDADADTRTAWVSIPHSYGQRHIDFGRIQSVAMCQGPHVVQAWGAPYPRTSPEWINHAVRYAEVDA